MAADIFAPPTPEELKETKVFAPPTKEELGDSGISAGESALRGAAQGSTLGFSDELSGILPFLHALTTGSKITEDDRGRIMNAVNAYKMTRDDERKANEEARKANPTAFTASNVVAGALPAVLSGGASTGSVAAMGGAQGLGQSEADLTKGDVKGAVEDTGFGAGSAALLSALFKVAPKLAEKLKEGAGAMAERATGATGKFAEKEFQPGTGIKLLDRGMVGYGDSPGNIATKVTKGLGKAGGQIDEAISGMDKSGQIVDKESVINGLKGKIRDMESDPSKAPIIAKLKGFISDIEATPANVENLDSTVEGFTPSLAENTKRGYQSLANYADPEKTQAVKAAADVFKGSVEDAAQKAGPEIAENFATGKKDWGLLAPVEQAASGRATQLNQSPIGGLLDTATAGVGDFMAKGAEEGFGKNLAKGGVLAAARRAIVPRIASTMAKGTYDASNLLSKETPQVIQNIVSRLPQTIKGEDVQNQDIPIHNMGKYTIPLLKAKQRGPQALAVADYIFGNSGDPEYQRLKQGE